VQSLGDFFRGPVRDRYSSANFFDVSLTKLLEASVSIAAEKSYPRC